MRTRSPIATLILGLLIYSLAGCAGAPEPLTGENVTYFGAIRINLVPPHSTPCGYDARGCRQNYDLWIETFEDPDTGELIVHPEILGHELNHWLHWRSGGLVRGPHKRETK